jgi:glutamate N-acetyltransferase/amino-acid N-acetyltransferase
MANRGIMTTDTREKEFAIEYKGVKIGGIAKGSGMIAPDMATMLSFIYTDANFSSKILRRSLMRAVDKSFNMLSIDGDTSTNDTVLLTATGDFSMREEDFQRSLDEVCLELARKIALDGEGATKYVEVRVKGAKKRGDARIAAKSVVNSSLVKTAIFGGDPNWGRIIAALGYSGAEIDGDKISLFLGNPDEKVKDQNTVILNGEVLRLDEERFREILSKDKIIIEVDLGLGSGEAISFGCDLSYDYVKINGAYRT